MVIIREYTSIKLTWHYAPTSSEFLVSLPASTHRLLESHSQIAELQLRNLNKPHLH